MPTMRESLQYFSVFILTVAVNATAQAYGPTGHRIVGAIAAGYLCSDARATVASLLAGQSLAQAGLWPDTIRGERAWRHTAPWHYVNVADDVPIGRASGGERGDVLQALARFRAELADASRPLEQRVNALRFLAHFVADVHQPLHVGRADDRGGNEIAVSVAGRRSNLHRVWDAEALLRADRQARGSDYAAQVDAVRALTASRVAELQADAVLDWARESRAERHNVYAYSAPEAARAVVLDEVYLARAGRISMLRLSAAGVRLAGVLNGLFCPPAEGS